MESVINYLLDHPSATLAEEKEIKQFLELQSRDLFTSSLPGEGDPLTVLQPTTTSLGYLYFLYTLDPAGWLVNSGWVIRVARCMTVKEKSEARLLLTKTESFIQALPACSEIAIPKIEQLGEALLITSHCLENMLLIVPLLQGLLSKSTKIYTFFLQACILSNAPRLALDLLQKDFDSFTSTLQWDIRDYLLFRYYGGHVFASLKRYKEAAESYYLALAAPCPSPSAIQIAAYKKFLLISLLEGSWLNSSTCGLNLSLRLPRKIANFIRHHHHLNSTNYGIKPYEEFVNTAKKLQLSCQSIQQELQELMTTHHFIFVKDGNIDLIKLITNQIPSWSLQRLSLVYAVVGLSECAGLINQDALTTEHLLLDLINRNLLNVNISSELDGSTFVEFLLDAQLERKTDNLCEEMERVLGLVEKIRRFSHNKRFMSKAIWLALQQQQQQQQPTLQHHLAEGMDEVFDSHLFLDSEEVSIKSH